MRLGKLAWSEGPKTGPAAFITQGSQLGLSKGEVWDAGGWRPGIDTLRAQDGPTKKNDYPPPPPHHVSSAKTEL